MEMYMCVKLNLGDAFGWETEERAKMAILQMQEFDGKYSKECPQALLVKNEPYRDQNNGCKGYAYIPLVNIALGLCMIYYGATEDFHWGPKTELRAKWIIRGVATTLTGPLMILVDLVKFLFDLVVTKIYAHKNPEQMEKFNCHFDHGRSWWPGHPIYWAHDKPLAQVPEHGC
jgi:hypothetical protein